MREQTPIKKSNSGQGAIFFIFMMMVGACVAAAGTYGYLKYRIWKKQPQRYPARKIVDSGKFLAFGPEAKVFVASSLDRIFQDGQTLLAPEFRDRAEISLARHEYESFQVVVAAGSEPLKDVRLQIHDLINAQTGKWIGGENVSCRVTGYVSTEKPYYPVKYVGPWPDPLLPAKSVTVAPQKVQPFWITVYAPEGLPAGQYAGTVEVTAEGIKPLLVQVKAVVYDFTLPVAGSLKTAFDLYEHETFKRFPQKDNEPRNAYLERLAAINDKFLQTMLRYRINPVLNVDPRNDGELARVDRYLTMGLNNFSIGKKGGTLGNNWPVDDENIENLFTEYRTFGEMLKLYRLLDYTYIYTWDEGEIGNPVVQKLTSMIHRAYPGLKNMVAYHGFWDPDKDPDWGKDIDIWTFQIDDFNEEKMRKLQKIGKEIWMYVSGPGGMDSPNLAMDFDSIDYRIIPWLCWKYDIKGFLYWCVNWWPQVDPYQTAKNTSWEQNGNGLLFYPGNDEPVASLRLEIFRDGMEDYEYIQTLIKRLQQLKQLDKTDKYKDVIQMGIRIMTVDDTIASSMFHFSKNSRVLEERRNAIAQMIGSVDALIRELSGGQS